MRLQYRVGVRVPSPPISSIVEGLLLRAKDTPQGLAFVHRGESLTWASLLDESLAAAAALARAGLMRGGRCAIVQPTSLDFIRAFFGAQLMGAVPVALNPKMPPVQLAARLAELEAALVVTAPDRAAAIAPAVPTITPAGLRGVAPLALERVVLPDPGAISHLQVTSGTTGAPRAAAITYGNVIAANRGVLEHHELLTSDVYVGWLPLHHDLGLVGFVLEPVYFGLPGGCHLIESSMATLRLWLETIGRVGGTITAAPDFVYRLAGRVVAADTVDLRSLRMAISGGEAVKRSSIEAFESHFGLGPVIRPAYGLAEATLAVCILGLDRPRDVDAAGAVCCGRPLRDVAVRIADEDWREVPAGQQGRILVSGPTVFAGYVNDPDGTASLVRDGWLDTGDVGVMTPGGELYVHGRTRAMIKRAGAAIAPREIEELVEAFDGVRRAAAVGVELPGSFTEDVIVMVEVERSCTPQVVADLRERIADELRRTLGFVPRAIEPVAPGVIPRTASGKIQYGALKARVAARVATGGEPSGPGAA